MDSSRLLKPVCIVIFAGSTLGGCGSSDPSGARLSAGDFVRSPANPQTPPTSPAQSPVAAKPEPNKHAEPEAAPAPVASADDVRAEAGSPNVAPTPDALAGGEPGGQPGGPSTAAAGGEQGAGEQILIDAKIGDINNRALYASDFLEPMEAALRAKAVEMLKAAKGDTRAVRAAWEAYAQEQVGGRLVAFIRDEIFRAEGLSSLKPAQREGLSGYMSRLRDEEIRRNQGMLSMTEEEIARQTGGKSLDEYMRTREQTELIRFQLFQQIDRKIQVAWRDIKLAYEQNQEKYNPNPTAYLRMIVVSGADEEGVKAINDALAAGEDFATVAERPINLFNRDKGGLFTSQYAGDIAQATLTNFKPVNAVAVGLAPGTQAGPIDNGSTKAWIRMERIDQPKITLYDAQLGIENELFAQRQERAIQQYLVKLQGRASLSDVESMGLRVMQFARERCLEPVLRGGLAAAESGGK